MTKIKICGITNSEDAEFCTQCGADYLGFVFYGKSKRFIPPLQAKKIIENISRPVFKVGVFVNEDPVLVKQIAAECHLDFLQFHGDESPQYLKSFDSSRIIKALRVKDHLSLAKLKTYGKILFLFDTFKEGAFGGTGESFDWKLLAPLKNRKMPFFVSGGLTPENTGSLIRNLSPFGLDVSSGVEKSPGKKDHGLVRKFIQAVRTMDGK